MIILFLTKREKAAVSCPKVPRGQVPAASSWEAAWPPSGSPRRFLIKYQQIQTWGGILVFHQDANAPVSIRCLCLFWGLFLILSQVCTCLKEGAQGWRGVTWLRGPDLAWGCDRHFARHRALFGAVPSRYSQRHSDQSLYLGPEPRSRPVYKGMEVPVAPCSVVRSCPVITHRNGNRRNINIF